MTFVRALSLCAVAAVSGVLASSAPAQVTVWNYEVLGDAARVADPKPAGPIKIVAARNGTFSGAVAVGSPQPIKGLKAAAGELVGEGGAKIAAERVLVRYATYWDIGQGGPVGLDVLLESPPATVSADKGKALAGVWVTVAVPEGAKPGLYRGQLTIEAEGLSATKVPVELSVADWLVPDPQDWRTWIEMIQSPDTLALEYKLPLWSEKHWEMIARSFRLIRPTGSRVVYVPLLRYTNQGNAESMVRWVRGKDGKLRADYAIMDQYLDVAQKELGEIKLVVFYAWDAYLTRTFRDQSFETKPTTSGPAMDRWQKLQQGLTVTFLDEANHTTYPGALPHYTDPASKAIWQPVYDELRRKMKARGLEKAMALGMVTDMEPSKEEVRFLQEVSGGLSWIAHSHYQRLVNRPSPNKVLQGIADVRYEAHAYDLVYQVNPEKGRMYGWDLKSLSAFLDRFGELNGPPLRIRQVPLINITGRQRGVGRLGGDLWPAVRDARGRRAGQAFARYPENHWRGLNIGSYFLAPGPQGPVATSRLENLREGVQECEARIFLESALLDPARKAKLGDDLARRAQAVLDEHQFTLWRSIWSDEEALKLMGAISGRDTYEAIWAASEKVGKKLPGFWDGAARKMRSDEDRQGIDWFVSSGWQKRSQQLFEAAAEAQKKLK